MARIDLTKSFPPTTRSILDITEASRTSTQTKLNLVFNTNLGSSSSWVGTGISYIATVTVSGSGMSAQSASYTLKNSGDYWSGTGVHTTTAQPTFNIPASTTSINISVSYKYSDEATTMSGSTTLSLSRMMSTLGAIGTFNDTDRITLNIAKYNNDYTHELKVYKRNGSSVDTSVVYATRSGVENGDIFQFNLADVLVLYPQNTTIYDVPVMFVLSTYSGSTKIGDSSVQANVIISNANPTFNDFNYEDSNVITTSLTGDSSKIILGYSNLKVSIPEGKQAKPKKFASIEAYIVDDVSIPAGDYVLTSDVYFVAGKTYYEYFWGEYSALEEGASYNVGDEVATIGYEVYEFDDSALSTTINGYNKTSISVWAKDSRGLSTEVNKPLTTIAYTPIVKGNQNIARASSVGTQVNVEFEGTFWNDTFGNTTNGVVVWYRFKKSSSSTWTQGTFTGSLTISGNNFSYSGPIRGDSSDNGFEVDDSYDIELIVFDELSYVTYSYQLIAGNPAIIVKGNEVLSINNNGKNIIDVVNGLSTYSTTEYFTGKYWINNEPIYGIVVPVSFPTSSNDVVETPHYISNISMVTDYRLNWYDTTDARWYCYYKDTDDPYIYIDGISATSVRVKRSSRAVDWDSRTINKYAIIEYTKTTD